MKILVEAPQLYREVGFQYVLDRPLAEVLIPNPLYWVGLNNFPKLKIIATPSTGLNHIDLEECARRNITVLSLLDDREGLNQIRASSEFTFQLMLHALHRPFQQYKKYVHKPEMRGHELYGKYVGIIGYGRIGKNIAKWCTAFDADWDYYDPKYKPGNLGKLFSRCDIVVISCSLTEETEGMITSKYLETMKPGAILVNTARAEIVNERDLVNWAKKGLNTYAADVLHGEVTGNHVKSELLQLPNCIITPHIAGATVESEEKAIKIIFKLLRKELT